ncbi:MAG: universal stress protein [Polyangiaceae bacterium]|nr:universal stress protein [Polyangiaceae bacterium]
MHVPQVPEPSIGRARAILERIFVPVDFSMESHRAVGVALALQRSLGAEVCLFHAVQSDGTNEFLGGIGSPAVLGDWRAAAEERLRRFIDNVVPGYPHPIEVRAHVDAHSPHVIHDQAHLWGATLIVLCADVRGLLRSDAERIVHDFDIPVLVIPKRKPS